MRTHIIQTNFTAGEITPKLLGRVDVSRYANAAKTVENCTVVVQGGVRRRDGLKYINTCKQVNDAAGNPKPVRLVPWVYSREEAYVLELGDLYLRIFQNEGQVLSDPADKNSAPVEVVTPFLAEELAALSFTQGADTMFFAHPNHPPQQLKRNSQTDWKLEALPLDPAPFADTKESPAAMAFISAVGPVGRIVEIRLADPNCQLTATSWTDAETHDGKGPTYWQQILYSAATTGTGAHPRNTPPDDVGFEFAKTKTGTSSGIDYGVDSPDVGKYIRINGGLLQILRVMTKVTTAGYTRTKANVAWGVVRSIAGFLDGSGGDAWTLERKVWGEKDKAGNDMGWPSCVTMHQQRLLFANSKAFPQMIWGSAIREYGNFELGYMDDQAYAFQVSSDQINPISALFSLNGLIALTHSGEFLITGANNQITPTNINVRSPSSYGSAVVRPVRVGTELMYVQRAGRKLLDLNYDPDSTAGFSISNMNLLAEHMTQSGIVDMTYQQEPDGLIHIVTGDGQLLTITFDKESEVTGWTRNHTGATYDSTGEPITWDKFKNVAAIPHATGVDQCYAIVERTIGGKPVLYVEVFKPDLNVDAALIGLLDPLDPTAKPQTHWQALEHLEGEECDIVADGVVMNRDTVKAGAIDLPRPASVIEIGLPFYSRVRTLNPEFQTPGGSASGMHVSTVHLYIRLLNSIGMTINGDRVPFRKFGPEILNKAPELFTGDVNWQALGQDNNEVLIEQRQPLPFHLLAVIRTITAN